MRDKIILLIALFCMSFTEQELCLVDKLTIITTTSPIPSNPSTEMLEITQRSLFMIPEFRGCKKIIVFDGVPAQQRYRSLAYYTFIRNVEKLVREDPYFYNTTLVINHDFKHLANSLREAINIVDTPYIFVHQHDFSLIKKFDIANLVRSMDSNPNLKHIRLNKWVTASNWWDGEVDSVIVGGSLVPLTRIFGWSDNDHISRTDYYRDFVFPKIPWNGAMEWFLHDQPDILRNHLLYGTYLYGSIGDGPYILHLDGRSY